MKPVVICQDKGHQRTSNTQTFWGDTKYYLSSPAEWELMKPGNQCDNSSESSDSGSNKSFSLVFGNSSGSECIIDADICSSSHKLEKEISWKEVPEICIPAKVNNQK